MLGEGPFCLGSSYLSSRSILTGVDFLSLTPFSLDPITDESAYFVQYYG